jgi:hypothetical protein
MEFLKDSLKTLINTSDVIATPPTQAGLPKPLASITALLNVVAQELGVPLEAAQAVWMVEAGDLPFIEGKPILRFECHKLWEHWGQHHNERFDEHFRFGGRHNTAGASWTNHAFRTASDQTWQSFHGAQDKEYEVFELATQLAGLEIACLSSSFGGPQILGSNHAVIGYETAFQLYRAFSERLDAQIFGFFDFCLSKNIINALKEKNWVEFARTYNGPGKANVYADHINDAYLGARSMFHDEPKHPSLEDKDRFDRPAFTSFIKTLGLKHFTASELLFRGTQHADPLQEGWGLNRMPPEPLWANIAGAIRALDKFRAVVGTPITLTSIYRSQDYNTAIGGAENSRHCRFEAIDFEVRSATPTSTWIEKLRELRSTGQFTGAIGTHGKVIHLDVRGENVDF